VTVTTTGVPGWAGDAAGVGGAAAEAGGVLGAADDRVTDAEAGEAADVTI